MSTLGTRTPLGSRPHKVTVQNPGEPQPDGDGGYITVPIVSPEPWWVSIVAATFRDLQVPQGGTVLATKIHVVRGPYRTDVSTKTRLVLVDQNGTTREFDVSGLDNVEMRNFELVCTVTEVEQPDMPARSAPAAVEPEPTTPAPTAPVPMPSAWENL